MARLIDEPPHTVMHGDAHPGNVYFRDGAAGLLDWQAVRRGHPGRELAYTLVTGMTTDDRRQHQRELLDHYRGALAAAGGPELDADESVGPLPNGRAVPLRGGADHRRDGRHAGREHRTAGSTAGVAALDDLDTVALLQKSL